ncbi:hypothetical protein CSOJ01_10329 [Colletotrichum sojae]|uniref:Hemerythrin-like domain-containing protein n=1 Tax=Colletotrichum sojae TaxID=2175907 RepID=A0A8H6MPD3_9PEZI|nr:hypothetical protein CSOJ01_10329 [Colletotrichum sojae]
MVSEMASLSPADFEIFNRLADMMSTFHNHFRRTWKKLQNSCNPPVDGPPKMTDEQIVREGLFFCYRLTNHHDIEETMFFPMLARKMPEFSGTDAVLLEQHRQIHHGLEDMQQYLEECRSRKRRFDLPTLKGKMDPWGDVLLLHLDQEVEMLSAENMRRYWTREEMLEMPI